MAPKKDIMEFRTSERILCRHGPFFYDAKIVDIKQDAGQYSYHVHYTGWHKRHDEWIPAKDTDHKFKKFSEEALAAARAEVAEATAAKSKRKSRAKLGENPDDENQPSESKTASASRGTTPSDKVYPPGLESKATSVNEKIVEKSETSEKSKVEIKPSRKRKATDESTSAETEHVPSRDQPEGKINIPLSLKEILGDMNSILDKKMLYKLPATHTVDSIVEEYISTIQSPTRQCVYIEYENCNGRYNTETLVDSAIGVVDYFNSILPRQLLDKFESLQYQRISEVKKTTPSSSVVEKKKEAPSSSSKRRQSRREVREEPEEVKPVVEKEQFRPSAYYGLPHLLRLLSRMDNYLRLSYSEHTTRHLLNHIADFVVYLNKNRKKYYNESEDFEKASADYIKNSLG